MSQLALEVTWDVCSAEQSGWTPDSWSVFPEARVPLFVCSIVPTLPGQPLPKRKSEHGACFCVCVCPRARVRAHMFLRMPRVIFIPQEIEVLFPLSCDMQVYLLRKRSVKALYFCVSKFLTRFLYLCFIQKDHMPSFGKETLKDWVSVLSGSVAVTGHSHPSNSRAHSCTPTLCT